MLKKKRGLALWVCFLLVSLGSSGCEQDREVFNARWAAKPQQIADSGEYAFPGAVLPCDLDKDNDLDLAAIGPASLSWFENKGGCPPEFDQHLIDEKGCANAVLGIDVNGDGLTDLVSAAGRGPDGREMPGELYAWLHPARPGGEWKRTVLDDHPGNFLHDLAFADLDNDGFPEIVCPRGAAYQASTDHEQDWIAVYRTGRGDSGPIQSRILVRNKEGVKRPEDFSLAVGDMNNDGFSDVIQFQGILLNPGGRLDDAWQETAWTHEIRPSNLVVEDMNQDGLLDLVFAEGHSHRGGSSRVGIWFNGTERLDEVKGRVTVLGRVEQDPENLAVSDLDGNGVPDIVTGAMNWRNNAEGLSNPSWNDRDADLVVFYGRETKDGGRRWVARTIAKGIAAFHHLVLADMDGDGDLDIVGENAGAAPPPAEVVPSVQILWNLTPREGGR